MKQVVIENPILNSLYVEPTRHFRFTDEGITNEIVDGRRTSSYFVHREGAEEGQAAPDRDGGMDAGPDRGDITEVARKYGDA